MLWAVLLLFLIIYLYFYFTKNDDYWKKRNVPYEKPKFFFGNIKESVIGPKHIGILYKELYNKFKGYPYFGYFKLNEPAIIIRDPQLAKCVMVKDFASFADNDFRINKEIDRIWASNPFIQTGLLWKKSRSAWTYSMTTSKIKAMYACIDKKCDAMVEYIKNHIEHYPDEPLEPRELSVKFFTDVIVGSIFGVNINSFLEPYNPYNKITKSLFVSSLWNGIVRLTILLVPWLGRILKFRFVPQNTENELLVLAKEILEIRKKNGFQKNNPLDSLILHGEKKDAITDLEVAGLLFGFLLDGTETSSGAAGYMLTALAANPDIQTKLRTEIDEAVEKNGGKMSYEIIHELPYLDMVLSETLRMYPPLITSQRLCTKPYELPPVHPGDDPVKVPLGMTVVISQYALQNDEEYFPDPEKFDPERFNKENKANIKKFTYMPFGDGPRTCLGTRLALNQSKIGMAALIRNFEVRLAPKMIGKPLIVDPNILLLRNLGGLWVTFHNRKR